MLELCSSEHIFFFFSLFFRHAYAFDSLSFLSSRAPSEWPRHGTVPGSHAGRADFQSPFRGPLCPGLLAELPQGFTQELCWPLLSPWAW